MDDSFGSRWNRFTGVEEPPSVQLRTIDTAEYSASRLEWPAVDGGNPVRFDRADGYLLCIQRRDLPAPPYWIDDRPVTMTPLGQGQSLLFDLREQHSSITFGTVDCLSIFASGAALQLFHEENDLRPTGSLAVPRGRTVDDRIARSLGECLLPAIEAPASASKLFTDYVGLALLTHLLKTYGGQERLAQSIRGGLAPWQERRAKELLLAHIDGGVGLEELAEVCGLSRSHFARAFKRTVGLSPLKWLANQRIERAKHLLLNTSWPLQQIAQACGFADHSHLSRAFLAQVKVSPGLWRRLRGL